MRIPVAAALIAACVAGCSAPHRTLTLVPSLPATMPPCVPAGAVNTLRVTAQGDFPPETTLTAAASPAMAATLALPAATRAIDVEGFGPTGLAAFGRTATLTLDELPAGPLGIAYGPPDSVCAAGAMLVARAGHHATPLAGGRVLITGGYNSGDGPATQVELYDPRTASFALTGASLDPRSVLAHATAPLPDGGALVTGGAVNDLKDLPAGIAFAGAVRFDADGKTVGSARLLVAGPRAGHSATVLADGRVLLAGGCQNLDAGACVAGATLGSTEIYDPKADAFAAGPPLLHARVGHSAILLGDGTVLVVGGRGEGGGAVPAEVVDPDEDRGFDAGVASGAGVGLPAGSALLAGGTTTPDVTMSLWPSATEAPLALPPLSAPRLGPTLSPLDDGSVLVAGGGDGTLALFDGRASVTTLAATFHANDLAAARLADGTVLLTGGAGMDATVWEWDGGAWSPLSVAAGPVGRSAFGWAYDDVAARAVLFGGVDAGGAALADTWRFDFSSPSEAGEDCDSGFDGNGNGLVGCADPDCAGECALCGDGVCSEVESCRLCPADCGACAE
ncbi:MAG TPA: kelch repeat-containing protein, partial [Polyangia bacterium]